MNATVAEKPSRLEELWTYIGDSELAFQIGATWWFPLLESVHVLAIVTLVGAIIMADLRILRRSGTQYAIAQFVPEHTRWVWYMIVPAVVTGIALFITRPQGYADNLAFQIKLVLLALAVLNLVLLYRKWHPAEDQEAGIHAKAAAGISLILWVGVVFAGRWIGHLS